MSINVGTIVTRFDPDEKVRSCTDGTCVGKITHIESSWRKRDYPEITVEWWELCGYHAPLRPVSMVDELWEIGQIPQN